MCIYAELNSTLSSNKQTCDSFKGKKQSLCCAVAGNLFILLSWFGSTCSRGKSHCKSIESPSINDRFAICDTFTDGSGLFRTNPYPIHKAHGLTVWFDNAHHVLWNSHSPDFSPVQISEHHHQNTPERVMFRRRVLYTCKTKHKVLTVLTKHRLSLGGGGTMFCCINILMQQNVASARN